MDDEALLRLDYLSGNDTRSLDPVSFRWMRYALLEHPTKRLLRDGFEVDLRDVRGRKAKDVVYALYYSDVDFRYCYNYLLYYADEPLLAYVRQFM